ncbi:hypothetical protein GE061_006693 [Apolygus lucorum]|uniref:CCHC-type domain-containing protein n=1 Tax=Apolygus lucorum TaxID=248454 RepID=A0A8S9WTX9_APOLU|nr:hypothetical protein GE061_006693 [Apolygus lucorum]
MGKATENRSCATAGIKQFDGKGFLTWKIRIRAALDELGLLKVISDDHMNMSKFHEANRKAKNVIIQNLHDRIIHSVYDKEYAKDIMDCLEKTYARSGLSEQIELKGKLNSMKFKSGSLTNYFEEFDQIVTDLANAGSNLSDQELVAILLGGMPRSYNSVTASLDIVFSAEKEIDIYFVKNKLLLEESRQRKQGQRDSDSSVFVSQRGRGQLQDKRYSSNTGSFPYKCYKCFETGHKRNECPLNNSQEKPEVDGSQNRRYDSKFLPSEGSHRQSARGAAHVETEEEEEIAFACGSVNSFENTGITVQSESVPTIEFLVDSGSSDHLINDVTYLMEVEELQNPIAIRVAKEGESLLATKRGTLRTKSLLLNGFLVFLKQEGKFAVERMSNLGKLLFRRSFNP